MVCPSEPSVPLYFQIKRHLLDKITAGELKVGDRIPAEEVLATQFAVSRMTARHAVTALVHEGCLIRRQGVGTFVVEPRIEREVLGLTTLAEEFQSRGQAGKLRTQVLSCRQVAAPPLLAQRVGLEVGTPLTRITRVRFTDDVPLAVQVLRIPARIGKGLDREKLEGGSLYPLLEERFRCPLGRGEQSVEAVAASAFHARLLNIRPGTPLLMVWREVYLATGEFANLSRTLYRSDRYILRMTLQRRIMYST